MTGSGTHDLLMRRLAKVSLLVLDDWGLQGFSVGGRRDLLEIAEARHGRKSILIASQIRGLQAARLHPLQSATITSDK